MSMSRSSSSSSFTTLRLALEEMEETGTPESFVAYERLVEKMVGDSWESNDCHGWWPLLSEEE